jgi:hypothetical protein
MQLPGLLGMGPGLGRPVRVTQPLLQLGRLLVQLHRGQVGGRLPLLDLEEAISSPGRGPMVSWAAPARSWTCW